jgi:hypothetical protein
MFNLSFDTEGAAFDNAPNEIARILRAVTDKVERWYETEA